MKRQEALDRGLKYYCIGCRTAYKEIPTQDYPDGHGGREIQMCKCGSDLFAHLEDDSPVK